MKPDWDSLASEYEGSDKVVIADVDCTAGGKPLCEKFGVKGYPTIKCAPRPRRARAVPAPRPRRARAAPTTTPMTGLRPPRDLGRWRAGCVSSLPRSSSGSRPT